MAAFSLAVLYDLSNKLEVFTMPDVVNYHKAAYESVPGFVDLEAESLNDN